MKIDQGNIWFMVFQRNLWWVNNYLYDETKWGMNYDSIAIYLILRLRNTSSQFFGLKSELLLYKISEQHKDWDPLIYNLLFICLCCYQTIK